MRSGFEANVRFGLLIAGVACVSVGSMLVGPAVALAQEAPASVVLPPAATPAQAPADESVILRTGGLVRGHVLEVVAGDHATIALETGEVRTIPWNEIQRLIVSTANPVATSRAEPAPVPPPPPLPMDGPLAWVHIATPKFVQLNRRASEAAAWVHACDSPCDIDLPLGDEYELAGLGNGPTSPFHLKAAPGQQIVLTVDVPSTGGIVLGGVLGVGGAVGLYASSLLALATSGCTSECGHSGTLVAMGISAAALAVGVLVIVSSARTNIVESNSRSAPPAPPSSPPPSAFLREPTWRTAPELAPPINGSFTVPLFSRAF